MADFIEEENDTKKSRTNTMETRGIPLQTGDENADAENDDAPRSSTDRDESEKPEKS